jgi:hypothetical protein
MVHNLSATELTRILREHRLAMNALQVLDDFNIFETGPGDKSKLARAKHEALAALYPPDGQADIPTRDLTGRALDYALATMMFSDHDLWDGTLESAGRIAQLDGRPFSPTSDAEQARAVIDRYGIAVWPDTERGGWLASSNDGRGDDVSAKTEHMAGLLSAAISYHGDYTEVPRKLFEQGADHINPA